MAICQAKLIESSQNSISSNYLNTPKRVNHYEERRSSPRDSSYNAVPLKSSYKENIPLQNSPIRTSYTPVKPSESTPYIINCFQEGNDEKAILEWRNQSYAPLPVPDSHNFYILALKLKDMQIMESENTEKCNKDRDLQIAQENEKLKDEIQNLAEAIDSIMRENDRRKHLKSDTHTISFSQSENQMRKEIERMEKLLQDKEDRIRELEKGEIIGTFSYS